MDPFTSAFMLRALAAGVLVAVLCAVVGTWVVARGMAFLGEAMAHGVLPGVALATLVGAPVLLGAAVSAAVMSVGVSVVQHRWRLSADTSIGLLFVASLALGVVIISGSGTFATDATAILFGDILAVRPDQVVALAAATLVTVGLATAFHRPFVALAVDPRQARLLGLRPKLAQAMLVGLIAIAVVSAYQAVGSLLVLGMLLGPVVAANRWTVRLPTTMALGACIGAIAVWVGLLVSWHAGTAAGATVALAAVASVPASAAIRELVRRSRSRDRTGSRTGLPSGRGTTSLHRRRTSTAVVTAMVLAVAGCAGPSGLPTGSGADAAGFEEDGHGRVEGAQELAEAQAHLLTVDEQGSVAHLDLLDASIEELGALVGVESLASEGRYAYAVRPAADAVTVIDSGVWTWSHVDHFHYYRADPRKLGEIAGQGGATVSASDAGMGAFFAASGEAVLILSETLGHGSLDEAFRVQVAPHDGLIVPVGTRAVVTEPGADGVADRVRALAADGSPGAATACPAAKGTITTVVGVVIGCRDGAVLANAGEDGTIAFERIPYPDDVEAPRAEQFDARESRPTVAALAGGTGATSIWLLDTRARAWRLIEAGEPLARVTAVDDADGHVLALTMSGRVLVLDGATGGRLASTEPLLAATVADQARLAGVELIADQHRAYLNGVAERRLFEIDFADGARVARTFETAAEPRFLLETGR